MLPGFAGPSTWTALVDTLSRTDATGRSLPTVVVLDNCEHVLAGVGRVIAELLAAVAGLTILTTSREPVGWVDERLLRVPPLSQRQALDLFRQRAELTGYPVIGADQVEVAERICRRMHGHPLFIRLAAARTFYEPLPMILQQLSGNDDDRRMLWRHGPRVGTDSRPETDFGLPAAVEFAWGASLLLHRCDVRSAVVLARAREKYAAQGDRGGESLSSLFGAVAMAFFGTASHALDATRNHLERTASSGARWAMSWAELAWAIALTKHADPAEALTAAHSALTYQIPRRDLWGVLWAAHIRMWSLARIITDATAASPAEKTRRIALATEIAQLAGGSTTLRTRLGTAEVGPFAEETTRALAVARGVLGQQTLDVAQTQGSRLSIESDEVRHLALGTSTTSDPRRDVSDTWCTLTGAEQDVAILAAAGWSNSAIGVRRGTSIKTINTQMTSILQKLTITSREDIIGFVPADHRELVSREHSRRPRRNRIGR
ncbi:LuxR C-terminal-related transcriptional regulator [Nocardia sp. NPDC051990]|uniref:helix-turn-helix transcriptional regulator n=1 Tax=Nocardia sp. NPDC051990 TaxID=3155285 RepID=UPI0034352F42